MFLLIPIPAGLNPMSQLESMATNPGGMLDKVGKFFGGKNVRWFVSKVLMMRAIADSGFLSYVNWADFGLVTLGVAGQFYKPASENPGVAEKLYGIVTSWPVLLGLFGLSRAANIGRWDLTDIQKYIRGDVLKELKPKNFDYQCDIHTERIIRILSSDKNIMPSMIWGPQGSGKTTVAIEILRRRIKNLKERQSKDYQDSKAHILDVIALRKLLKEMQEQAEVFGQSGLVGKEASNAISELMHECIITHQGLLIDDARLYLKGLDEDLLSCFHRDLEGQHGLSANTIITLPTPPQAVIESNRHLQGLNETERRAEITNTFQRCFCLRLPEQKPLRGSDLSPEALAAVLEHIHSEPIPPAKTWDQYVRKFILEDKNNEFGLNDHSKNIAAEILGYQKQGDQWFLTNPGTIDSYVDPANFPLGGRFIEIAVRFLAIHLRESQYDNETIDAKNLKNTLEETILSRMVLNNYVSSIVPISWQEAHSTSGTYSTCDVFNQFKKDYREQVANAVSQVGTDGSSDVANPEQLIRNFCQQLGYQLKENDSSSAGDYRTGNYFTLKNYGETGYKNLTRTRTDSRGNPINNWAFALNNSNFNVDRDKLNFLLFPATQTGSGSYIIPLLAFAPSQPGVIYRGHIEADVHGSQVVIEEQATNKNEFLNWFK